MSSVIKCEAITNYGNRCNNKACPQENVCKIHDFRYRCEYILKTGKRCGRMKRRGLDLCSLHEPIDTPTVVPDIATIVSEPKICDICYESFGPEIEFIELTDCKHSFCSKCISTWVFRKKNCPMCRGNVNSADISKCALFVSDNRLFGSYTLTIMYYSFVFPRQLWMDFIIFIRARYQLAKAYRESEFLEIIDYMKTDSRFEEYASVEYMNRRSRIITMVTKYDSSDNGKNLFVLSECLFDLRTNEYFAVNDLYNF